MMKSKGSVVYYVSVMQWNT